ncbi:MAG: tetratricopeptide repeat protein [Nitrospirae bacterium]|nr:tetratricopeptide repeat protein [Nitrospirota bacterium]
MLSLHFKESPQQTAEILQCSAYRNKTVINLIAYLPYILLVIIPYLLYRIYSFGRVMGGEPRDFYTNLLTQPRVLLRYLQLLFLPAGLTIEHTIASASEIYNVFVILPVLALIVLAVAAYLLFRKAGEWRVLSFFMAWFFITLLPTTLIPLNAILQENRGYLAGIGFPIFAGICIGRLPRRASVPLLLVVVSLCSIATIQRNQVWKDEYTLWRDAVDKAPYSARAHDNLGLAHITRGEYGRAIDEFNKTIEIQPRYYLAYYNAGVVYQMQNNLDSAKSSYEACLRINPQYFRAYYNLGILFKKAGELDQAISNYEKAISLDPRHPFVYNNLGVAFTEKGERDKAESAFKRATELDPEFIKAYFNLGNLYYRTGRHNLAAEAYRTVLKLQPDYKEAERMLNAAMGTGSGLEF